MATLGSQWQHAQVNCHCDNQAAANVINKGSARDPLLVHLLRYLFLCYPFSIPFTAQHIPRHSNLAVDALSQDQLTTFFSSLSLSGESSTRSNQPCSIITGIPTISHMDLQSLEVSLSKPINQGIAPITARVYNSAQSRFL